MENRNRAEFYACPERWDAGTDVVIIGSGLAGFAAADLLLDGGNKVMILEKMPYMGGNSVLAGGGYACWDSSLKYRQELGLGEDSPEQHFEDTLIGGNRCNIRELLWRMVEKAPEGMDWLVSKGVTFKKLLVKIGCHTAYRCYQGSMSGKEAMTCIKNSVCEKGAQLLLKHEVTCLYREGIDGRVIGVRVNTPEGEKTIRAEKAVVIASGGFSNDVAFRMLYRPDLNELYSCSNHKGATGEMIRFAQAVGADTLHMAFIQLFPCANPKTGMVDRFAFYSYSSAGFGAVYVDGKGQRFVSELAGRDDVSNAQIDSGDGPTYCLLNDEIIRQLGVTDSEFENGKKNGRFLFGGTVAELEEKMGLEKGRLWQTLSEHNDAIKNLNDPLFGKPMEASMTPFAENESIYAVPQWPSVHYTHGGIRINADAEVLDVLGNAIPGLYAAGEVCGGTHGSNRLGGHGLAECVVFGRVAAEQINMK